MSTLAMVPIGALMSDGSLSRLLTTDDAWVGIATTPWVAAFVMVGTAIGAWSGWTWLRWALGLLPLPAFALLLITLDYFVDLGEGNQVFTYLGVGLVIAACFAGPAFIVRRKTPRMLLMLLPPCIIGTGAILLLSQVF